MKQRHLKISLSECMTGLLQHEAERLEIKPSVLARIRLCQIYKVDDSAKSYLVDLKNWRKIETYAETKGFSIGIFLDKAAEWYMKKYHLSAVQKAAIKGNIEKQEKTPADASAGL